MKNYPIRKISLISITSFIGIILMQAFWIYDSYQERQAHFHEHIYRILDQAETNLCKELPNLNSENQQKLLDSIMAVEMSHLEEKPKYWCNISSNKYSINNLNDGEMLFEQHISCKAASDKRIILLIYNTPSYFLQSLFVWIILSVLLIFIAIFLAGINLSIIRKQKKLGQIQSDFIGNMTHELKTPIATISVASEMLMKDRVLDNREKSKRYSKIIFEENLRLKKLVERVMQIALFEHGTMKIKLKEVDLHDAINQSCDAISMIINKRKGILTKKLKATDTIYRVDATHFSNIITNLLENAIKYSPDKLQIGIQTRDYSDGILISIEDLGIGINKKYQERIFDRFFRVQNGDIHNTKGFGLGLYYVRRIVEAHGGTIKVYSEEGKGSRFEIYLPKL
jgi:signal transduction histidine kinase